MDSKLQEYIQRCYDRYLSIRPRSVYEMKVYLRQKLIRKAIDPDEQEKLIGETIKQLEEDYRLNDESFVRWYVAEKNYFKPRGRIRLKHDLAAKGIQSDLVARVLEENNIPDTDLIIQLLDTKYKMVDLTDEETKERLVARLRRQGFQFHDIKNAIEEFAQRE